MVRPLIWLRELKRTEPPLIMAAPTTAAAVIRGKPWPQAADRDVSMSMAEAAARPTSRKVRRPAAWRLADRSQPMTAARTAARAIRSTTAPAVREADQGPSRAAMGSVTVRKVFMA